MAETQPSLGRRALFASKSVELLLRRTQILPGVTLGEITIDGSHQCFTLEDEVRAAGVKIAGQTAIPFGRYEIIVDRSERFQEFLPRLLDVPLFTGIRIHAGNDAGDTEGCILVGEEIQGHRLVRSRLALDPLFMKLSHAQLAHERNYITVTQA